MAALSYGGPSPTWTACVILQNLDHDFIRVHFYALFQQVTLLLRL